MVLECTNLLPFCRVSMVYSLAWCEGGGGLGAQEILISSSPSMYVGF